MKKLFAGFLLSTFLFYGLTLAPTPSAAINAGQLVKGSTAAVYYVGTDLKRWAFPNEKIYFSWFLDFSSVQKISDAELASLPLGGNARYRAGTRLVKLTTDPKVYALEGQDKLRPIPDEATARALYGTNWSSKVDDLSDAFFTNYTLGAELSTASHPRGTIFKYSGNLQIYYLDSVNNVLTARPIASTEFSQTNFNSANLLEISASFAYPTGANIKAADLPTITVATAPTPIPAEPISEDATLNVALSSGLNDDLIGVKGDQKAKILALTFTGDQSHNLSIKQLNFTFGIDTNHQDSDWQIGTDEDTDRVLWSANQIIASPQIIDHDTGLQLGTCTISGSDGRCVMITNFSVAAQTTRNLDLLVRTDVITADHSRISAGINTGLDISASASTAKSITISPANTWLNNPVSPTIIFTPEAEGSLTVDARSDYTNAILPLGQTYIPYILTFTSEGEDFVINKLKLVLTNAGKNFTAISDVKLNYTPQADVAKSPSFTLLDQQNIYFEQLEIYVPKDSTIEVPVSLKIQSDDEIYSNARLQLDFSPQTFYTIGQISSRGLNEGDFGSNSALVDQTSSGPLHIYRNGYLNFSKHSEMPSGLIPRYGKQTMLTYNVSAVNHAMTLKQLAFKITTSDLGKSGSDNDFFERWANILPSQIGALYSHSLNNKEDRTQINASSVTFGLYDHVTQTINTAPGDLQSNVDTYAVLLFNLGTGLTIQAGDTRAYDLDLDTTSTTTGLSTSIQVKITGDSSTVVANNANILWDDGSNINATGYLLGGLDLNGNNLSINLN